jgi:hypothetical protein
MRSVCNLLILREQGSSNALGLSGRNPDPLFALLVGNIGLTISKHLSKIETLRYHRVDFREEVRLHSAINPTAHDNEKRQRQET